MIVIYEVNLSVDRAIADAYAAWLADHIRERAVYLTRFAVDQGLLSIRDPRISALAVVGAVEQLTWSFLSGELDAPPDEIARTLISLVLSGIRS